MNGDADDMLTRVREDRVREVRIAFLDYNGLPRARSVAPEHLPRVLEHGVNFSSPTVDFNSRDQFPPGAAFDLASPDVWARPDPATYRPAPGDADIAEMLADLVDGGGEPWEGCPRTRLRAQIDRARGMGLDFLLGFEPEGYVFRDAAGISFVDTPKFATLDGLDVERDFMRDLLSYLTEARIEVEQWSEEYGPGQVEVNLRYAPALHSADTLAVYRHAFRTLARRHGLLGTFMPKPFGDAAGSGLHVHISAADETGRNLFEGDDPLGLSGLGRGALAGLLAHGRALTALGASTVNSYKRFLPGSWAPTHVMYAYASRAAFIRIPERETPRRLELRVADGACNPYFLAAAILAAALDGIERHLEAAPPLPGDVASLAVGNSEMAPPLPGTLAEALDSLETDDVIRAALGPLITDEYLKIKRSEWDAFIGHVGPWDREWYLGRY